MADFRVPEKPTCRRAAGIKVYFVDLASRHPLVDLASTMALHICISREVYVYVYIYISRSSPSPAISEGRSQLVPFIYRKATLGFQEIIREFGVV